MQAGRQVARLHMHVTGSDGCMSAQGVGCIEEGMLVSQAGARSSRTHRAVAVPVHALSCHRPCLCCCCPCCRLRRRIAAAIKEAGLQGRAHPLDYLQFFCLAKRESNEQYFGGVGGTQQHC